MNDTRTERLSLRLLPGTMDTVRAVASDLSAAAPRPVKPTVGAEYLLTLGARAYQRGERLGVEPPAAEEAAPRRRPAKPTPKRRARR